MRVAHPTETGLRDKEALVKGTDGRTSTGKLSIATPNRITLAFSLDPSRATGTRLVGDSTVITMTASGSVVEAEILTTSLIGYVEVCEFRITRHLDGPPLGATGERRSSARHRPHRPISANVATLPDSSQTYAQPRTVTGMIGDLSAGGCGIELAKADYRYLGNMTKATVSFRLPDEDDPVQLNAERKNTRSAGTELIWMGLSWSGGPANEQARQAITNYMASLPPS